MNPTFPKRDLARASTACLFCFAAPVATVALLTIFSGLVLCAQSTKPAAKTAAVPSSAQIARGKQLYSRECRICHYDNNALKKVGPGLKGYGAKMHGPSDAAARKIILQGGKNMPGFRDRLTDSELAALLAYLKTL